MLNGVQRQSAERETHDVLSQLLACSRSRSPKGYDDPQFVELFALELTHQIQSRVRPAIRARMNKADAAPRGSFARNKPIARVGTSKAPAAKPKQKRPRRGKSKPAFVRGLAARFGLAALNQSAYRIASRA